MNRTHPLLLAAALLLPPARGAAVERQTTPVESIDEGVLAALRGDVDRALRIASARAREPGALVLLASVSLDAGLPEEAAMMLEQLRRLRPDAAETKLLGALLAERRERPNAGWLAAGFAALQAVQPLPEAPPLLAPAAFKLDPPLQGSAARCLKTLHALPIRSLQQALAQERSRKGALSPERLRRMGLRCSEP